MTASMKARADRAAIELIRMSASTLLDDTQIHALRPPMRPATATIGEIIAMNQNAQTLRAQFSLIGGRS